MLAKILEDMWVEPEVLEALSEEQKRILFLKMREEQVRRWRAWEEREEREATDNITRPKKAYDKHVSWQLGRDGDVSVSVIGEVDEFRSSKLLQSLTNNRVHSDNTNGIQTADLLAGSEAPRLGPGGDIQLSLTDVSADPASPHGQSSEEDPDSCRDSDCESGGSSDNHDDWAALCGPHLSRHGNRPPLEAQLSAAESACRQDREEGREAMSCEQKRPEHGGRVAELRRAFTEGPRSQPPAHTKPRIPPKPAHLQQRATPLAR